MGKETEESQKLWAGFSLNGFPHSKSAVETEGLVSELKSRQSDFDAKVYTYCSGQV